MTKFKKFLLPFRFSNYHFLGISCLSQKCENSVKRLRLYWLEEKWNNGDYVLRSSIICVVSKIFHLLGRWSQEDERKGHVARMGRKGNVYRIWNNKSEMMKSLGNSLHESEDNIKVGLEFILMNSGPWYYPVEWGESSNELYVSINGRKNLLDQPNLWLVQKACV